MKSARKFRPYLLLFVVYLSKGFHYMSCCTVPFNIPSIVWCVVQSPNFEDLATQSHKHCAFIVHR